MFRSLRRPNSAAGFMGMSAIAEPAKRGKLRDFREQGADAMGRIADMERTYSRRVNHPAAARDGVNRARGRSVASLSHRFADLPRFAEAATASSPQDY